LGDEIQPARGVDVVAVLVLNIDCDGYLGPSLTLSGQTGPFKLAGHVGDVIRRGFDRLVRCLPRFPDVDGGLLHRCRRIRDTLRLCFCIGPSDRRLSSQERFQDAPHSDAALAFHPLQIRFRD
jgi:hypothetical protein